jgi:hypothetical protein
MCDREIVLLDEQKAIITWINNNEDKLVSNANYYGKFINIENIETHNIDIYNIIKTIKERLIQKENLQKYSTSEEIMSDFLYNNKPGTKLHLHKDRVNTPPNKTMVRFNLCIQKPDKGGRPIYAGNIIELVERSYVICRSQYDYHTSEWVYGEKSKINISFGFLIDYDDVKLYSNRENIILNNISVKVFNTLNVDSDTINSEANLLKNKKYKLSHKTNYDILEKYILDVVLSHASEKGIIFDHNTHTIEFYFNIHDNFSSNYSKKYKRSPVFSSIIFLSDNNSDILFTNIDIEAYKYKEIPQENIISIVCPKKNTNVLFDSSKYYGKIKFDPDSNCNDTCIVINLWENIVSDCDTYNNNDGNNNEVLNYTVSEYNNILYETINLENMVEEIVYDNNYYNIVKQIQKMKNKDINMIILKNIVGNNVDILMLIEKYGNIANELYPFFDNRSVNYNSNNKFHKKKIIKNILSKDVCYWIINECEMSNNWSENTLLNSMTKSLELIPSVLSFILFSSFFWTKEIKKLYDFDIDLNINNIFIVKNTIQTNVCNNFNCDKSFLTININLNNSNDYIGGEIIFDDDTINLNQGDMLVYNGQLPRNNNSVKNGVQYVLVLTIYIKQ